MGKISLFAMVVAIIGIDHCKIWEIPNHNRTMRTVPVALTLQYKNIFIKMMERSDVYMKRFINANICGGPESHELLVENGQFKAIGNDLNNADEVIDLKGHLV